MTPQDVLDLGQYALWTILKISIPLMLTALVVGLIISLFQALTQIQEMTLSFIPKIICLFIALIFLFPYIGQTLNSFTLNMFDRIVGIG